MRSTFLLASSLVLLALPLPLASAEESFNCHSWEILIGEREGNAVGVSPDDGAVYVGSSEDVPGGLYVISDGDPIRNPWIFNFWVYQEFNGEPGLQRGDEMCDDTEGGAAGESDCFVCCLCFSAPPQSVIRQPVLP